MLADSSTFEHAAPKDDAGATTAHANATIEERVRSDVCARQALDDVRREIIGVLRLSAWDGPVELRMERFSGAVTLSWI